MLVDKDRMIQLQEQNQLSQIIKTNEVSEHFGLSLTEQDAKLLLKERRNSLKKQRRIEFGEGIVAKIIYEFCDSPYICRDNYVETITGLQDIFYQYKNEMQDEITDDELLHLMKEQFEKICFGDLDYPPGRLTSMGLVLLRIRRPKHSVLTMRSFPIFPTMDPGACTTPL